MAGINHLRNVYEKQGEDFLKGLLNNYVIVNEKTSGNVFGFRKDQSTDKFKYYKKKNEITYIDRVLSRYYNPVIDYVDNLDEEVRQRIPSNLYFGTEFIPSTSTNVEDYSRMPKNNLILSFIHVQDENGRITETIQDKEKLNEWAEVLGIEGPTIVFEGLLNDEQKTEILEFVYTPLDNLADKFKTKSFVKHIINVLDPSINETFMDGSSMRDINGLIFRFYDRSKNGVNEDKAFLARLIDPMFERQLKDNSKRPSKTPEDYTWLIVNDLMNFIEQYNPTEIKKWNIKGSNYEERYVKFINIVYKEFMDKYENKYEGLELNKPEYLSQAEFDLNTDLIDDPYILDLIAEDDTHKEIYKILLNFFRNKRKSSPSPIFDDTMVQQLNLLVDKIKKMLWGEDVFEGFFPSFNEYIGEGGEYEAVDIEGFAKNKRGIDKPAKVNLLIGSFQPIHLGHIKAAEKLNKMNGLPVVLVALAKDKPSIAAPFSEMSQKIMLNKIEQEYKELIKDVILIKNGSIEDVIGALKPKYIPVLWGSGKKRIKSYGLQLNYLKKRNVPINMNKDFKLIETPQYQSGRDILGLIENEDFIGFKKLVPKSIASEFFNMKNEIDNLSRTNESKAINESAGLDTSPSELQENNDTTDGQEEEGNNV